MTQMSSNWSILLVAMKQELEAVDGMEIFSQLDLEIEMWLSEMSTADMTLPSCMKAILKRYVG